MTLHSHTGSINCSACLLGVYISLCSSRHALYRYKPRYKPRVTHAHPTATTTRSCNVNIMKGLATPAGRPQHGHDNCTLNSFLNGYRLHRAIASASITIHNTVAAACRQLPACQPRRAAACSQATAMLTLHQQTSPQSCRAVPQATSDTRVP
jgi:hypothetical protein